MDNNEKMTDHEYDGIRELDNDLPKWWLYMFYITIVWSVLYMLFYHVLDIGYLSADEYQREMNPNYTRVQEANGKLLGVFDEYRSPLYKPGGDITPAMKFTDQPAYVEMSAASDTATYETLADQVSIDAGLAVYQKNCAQCHGKLGEGGIGPNLTDSYWLHGGGYSSIVKSVKYGYPAKGMVAWRGTIKPDHIMQVSSYLMTILGSNPPNAKGPQGELAAE
jgi:cytochrome c oxidase cbb3-type subunit 3